MQTKLKVEGMSCSHCENAVKKTVLDISGVTDVIVDLAGKMVTVTHDEMVTVDSIKSQIEDQGYDIV